MTREDLNWDAVIAKAMEQPSDLMVLDTTPSMFYRAVVAVEHGDMTREQALIALALQLACLVQAQHKQLMDWINISPRPPFLMVKQPQSVDSDYFRSVHRKDGAHYNIYASKDAHGMAALRQIFPDASHVDSLNFVLFSTSGVHGMYTTIEETEVNMLRGNKDEDGEECSPSVTYLMIHPRIVCMRYGNCEPQTLDDIAYLKSLRAKSYEVIPEIGRVDG